MAGLEEMRDKKLVLDVDERRTATLLNAVKVYLLVLSFAPACIRACVAWRWAFSAPA